MQLDLPTIFVVMAIICGTVGAVFLFSWARHDSSDLVLRTGIGGVLAAVGAVLLASRGLIPGRLSIDVANALVLAGFGLAWSGARGYFGRNGPIPFALLGSAVWLVACTVPAIYGDLGNRLALVSAITFVYSAGCGYEFWRGDASEPTDSQRALAVVAFCHAGVLIFRIAYSLIGTPPAPDLEVNFIQGLLLVEPALALVAASLLGIGLVRERAVRELRRTAETDSLTGILNRRAFLDAARLVVDKARADSCPVALLVFDLDHFKGINDRYGHLVGDLALNAFTAIVSRAIRSTDLFGRIGGEEFAAMMMGVDQNTAEIIAERIRVEFARGGINHEGNRVTVTVSVGLSVSPGQDADLAVMLVEADRALYRAKRGGRDQVAAALPLAG